MAVQRNFVVKNGLQVNTSLLFADSTNNNIGIGSTQPSTTLDVIGGIAATQLSLSGISTITGAIYGEGGAASVLVGSGLSVAGITTLAGSGGITTTGGDFYVGGDLYVADDIVYDEISGRNLNVTGMSTLGIASASQLYVAGISTFAGNLEVAGNLDVTGDITYDEVSGRNLNITGIATAVQEFNVGTGGTVLYVDEQGTIRLGTATTLATVTLNGGSIPSVGLVIALGG